jgi:VWFA-related protein
MRCFLSLLLAAVAGLSPILVCGQTPASQDQDEVIRFKTNEVKLDIVVKDKKGRPVKDLRQSDFEILEDGVPQKVESFQFMVREGALAGAAPRTSSSDRVETTTPVPSTTTTPRPVRSTPAVTALVFDRLSPEARALARKAGITYAEESVTPGDFTGVFGIDQSLHTIQSFTDNPQLVKEAVDRVTGAASSSSVSGGAKMRENADRSIVLDNQIATSTQAAQAAGGARDSSSASAAGEAAGQAAVEQKFLEMQSQMLDHYERLERDQEGFASINSLLAVISPMQNLPGRKSIIFFSEGLKLPPGVLAKFPAVINAANRANVSIYTIDAAGLRIESGTVEAAKELNSLAAGRLQQQTRGNDRGSSGPYMRDLERNEDLLRYDARSGLGPLADQTGGFMIHSTNDLSAGLRRIEDDLHGYYFLTYVPQNKDFDGRFRQISVKVARSNVEIQSRKGYYAVESIGQLPMLDFEAPAIAAARNASSSAQGWFHGAALSYPVPGRPGLALVLAEAPTASFKFVQSADNKNYSTDFSIVALIRDASNQVVQKLSQHYALSGAAQDLEAAKKGDVLFYREAQLPPGKYTVQLIAYDVTTKNVNLDSSSLEIPGTDDTRPRLSSIAVLKRAERLTPEEQKQDQPLHFGELLVYPNLGERIDRATAKQLAFFFTAWTPKGVTKPMQVTLEIFQNHKSVGKSSAELPPADAQGRIKYASAFPLDKFQPGIFELKVTVSDGTNNVSRSTEFKIG